MTSSRISDRQGVTLVELVLAMAILAVLAGILDLTLVGNTDADRWEATREKLESLRLAIMGDAKALDTEGRRLNFGFFGDIGRMPTALSELTAQGALPSWSFDATKGTGAGWRGPYVPALVTGAANPADKDEWGNAFLYSTTPEPPSIMSRASDNAAGGTLYATDLQVTVPLNQRLATVHGNVADHERRISGATVAVYYATNGALHTDTAVTDPDGYFTFSNVPFGVRSIAVTSAPTLGPKPIVVDKSDYTVPTSTLNYFGDTQAITAVTGTPYTTNSGKNAFVTLSSNYERNLQLSFVTVTCAACGAVTVSNLIVNNVAQSFGAGLALATRQPISVTQTVPASSSVNSLELDFSAAVSGGTKPITVKLEWTDTTQTDTITFTPP